METNYHGTVNTFRATREELLRNKGQFVQIGSVYSYLADPEEFAYVASKQAARAFTESQEIELKQYGVSVTLVAPGHIADTEMEIPDTVPQSMKVPVTQAATMTMDGIEAGKRLVAYPGYAKLAVFLAPRFPKLVNRWIMPRFLRWQNTVRPPDPPASGGAAKNHDTIQRPPAPMGRFPARIQRRLRAAA
jgi:short-subunit dehydrogenase